jgi:hypothetical protein
MQGDEDCRCQRTGLASWETLDQCYNRIFAPQSPATPGWTSSLGSLQVGSAPTPSLASYVASGWTSLAETTESLTPLMMAWSDYLLERWMLVE